MPRRLLLPIALLAVLGLSIVGEASSAKPSYDTELTLKSSYDDAYIWKGKVKSSKQGCVNNRKAYLYNENSDEPLADDKAGPDGNYEIRTLHVMEGRYWTAVEVRNRPGYRCKAVRSEKIEPKR